MSRRVLLLAVLAAVLVAVLAWLLLLQPVANETADIRAETDRLEAQERELAARVVALQQVREAAPEAEAALAAASAVVPRETALPALLRQLQTAADDSGLTLSSVSTARPEPVADGTGGLARINVVVDVEGSYFQIVDFLRRLEDPAITPRGLGWNSMNVTGDPELYPVLAASMQGDLFAVLPAAGAALQAPPVDVPEEEDDDADVEVDVTIEEDAG